MRPIPPNLLALVIRTIYYGLMLWFGFLAATSGYLGLYLLHIGEYTLPWGFLAVAGLSGFLAMASREGSKGT